MYRHMVTHLVRTIPNSAIKTMVNSPHIIREAASQGHKIQCPYCHVGFAPMMVFLAQDGSNVVVEVEDGKNKQKCVTCGGVFGVRVIIGARPIEEEARRLMKKPEKKVKLFVPRGLEKPQ